MFTIKKHLKESKCTYLEHYAFAFKAGILMIIGGLVSIIHAFLPCVFQKTSAKIVLYLYNNRIKNHPNKTYRNMK